MSNDPKKNQKKPPHQQPHWRPKGGAGGDDAGDGKKALFTPEFLAQLEPNTGDIKRAQRRLVLAISGCGTLIVVAILLSLYLPYWSYKDQTEGAASEFLEAMQAGNVEQATELFPGHAPGETANLTRAVQQLLSDGGSYTLESLTVNNGAHVPGTIYTASGESYPFRVDVQQHEEHGGIVVGFRFTGREPRILAPPQTGPSE